MVWRNAIGNNLENKVRDVEMGEGVEGIENRKKRRENDKEKKNWKIGGRDFGGRKLDAFSRACVEGKGASHPLSCASILIVASAAASTSACAKPSPAAHRDTSSHSASSCLRTAGARSCSTTTPDAPS